MASVIGTVKYALLRYPTIFPTVGSVLHHLFLVIGNGYSWKDGDLVDHCTTVDFPINIREITEKKYRDYKNRIAELKVSHHQFDFTLDIERELHNYMFTVKHINRCVNCSTLQRAEIEGELYPLCVDYARIFNIPDNISTDWLWASYWFVQSIQQYLHQNTQLTDAEQLYADVIPQLHDKLKNMLIDRHELSLDNTILRAIAEAAKDTYS